MAFRAYLYVAPFFRVFGFVNNYVTSVLNRRGEVPSPVAQRKERSCMSQVRL